MSNPFLFNNFGGTSFQQQNYQNNQQNQGWNQNTVPSTTSTFQSQANQMDFFDMTTPQSNQTTVNNKPLGANDFRSLMNSPSNDSTTQFIQQNQPPPNLNQLRSMFTREDEPIIVPVTPQTNPPPPSSYSPSFTFMPETTNQHQPVFQQSQPQQPGQSSIDFSKYDPIAGGIINSNIAKQNVSNVNTQNVGKLPDNNDIPMVFYGADTTSMNNMPPNFQAFQGGQIPTNASNVNQNQTQQQQADFFNIQQSSPAANAFGQQVQQQPNTNFFNMQTAPSQSPNIFNNQNLNQQTANPASNIFDIQTIQQKQPETNIFNVQPEQQPIQPAQQQQQQNTDFFNLQPEQQSPQESTFSTNQPQQQDTASTNSNENPFLNLPKSQPNSTDASISIPSIPNSPANVSAPNEKQASSTSSIFDMFRVNDSQQPQQASNPPIILQAVESQQSSPISDIFGSPTQPNQSHQQQPQQQQQQPDIFDPFGRNKNASQQQQQPMTVSSANPFVADNPFQLDLNAPKSEPLFATIEDSYNPFGQPSTDKENPFSADEKQPQQNSQNSIPPPPASTAAQPTPAATAEPAAKPQNDFNAFPGPPNPLGQSSNDQANPFVGFTPNSSNPFIPVSPASQEKPDNQPPAAPPQNDIQQPFDPFGRNAKSNVEVKKEDDNRSSINYMRSLFASSSNDLFSKPSDQAANETTTATTTNANDAAAPTSVPKEEDQSQQPPQVEAPSAEQQQKEVPGDAQQSSPQVFDPFGVGSALPVVEGASFTFSFDDQDKQAGESANAGGAQVEAAASNAKSDTAPQAANAFDASPFSGFDFSHPVQQQPQQPQQQPQIVDDLFFDFTSIPPPKSDNQNDKTTPASENAQTVIDFTAPPPSTSASSQPQADSAAVDYDENVRPGTDESSMSLSGDDDEGIEERKSGATSTPQQDAPAEPVQRAEQKANEAEEPNKIDLKSSSSVGFYSDGVNTFTFDADKERLSGPNPFDISGGQAADKFNPFVKGAAPPNPQQNAAPTAATENSQKFNPFTLPAPTQSTQKQTEPKNAPSTDVFKTAAPKEPAAAISSTSDASFNPFGRPQPKTESEKDEQKKVEPAAASPFTPFSQPQPKTGSEKDEQKKVEPAAASPFTPFGQPQPKAESEKDEQKKAEPAAASPFTPFGQPQPPASNENQQADVPFNPFGQDFTKTVSDSNISGENSFTFKLRSNQTPEIDENDFLPVQNSSADQPAEEPASTDASQQPQQQQPDQPFSPFGVFNRPQQPQQPQQQQQPFGFGSFTSPPSQQSEPAAQSSQPQQQQQQSVRSSTTNSSSSSSPFITRRTSTNSANDPFSLLIASLTPFTENPDPNEADENEEADSRAQDQHGQGKPHEDAAAHDEQKSNPFTPWNPTELDQALGECEEPSELDQVALMRFKEKVPPLPPFVAFEQSMATRILSEYCTQLSETGTTLEHINELLGIQDMARISIEEFSA